MTGISAGKTWSRIGAEVAPTSSAASGVWLIGEVAENVGAGTWPAPPSGYVMVVGLPDTAGVDFYPYSMECLYSGTTIRIMGRWNDGSGGGGNQAARICGVNLDLSGGANAPTTVTGQTVWSFSITGATQEGIYSEQTGGLWVDSSDNSYEVGNVWGGVTYDYYNLGFAKFNSSGVLQWQGVFRQNTGSLSPGMQRAVCWHGGSDDDAVFMTVFQDSLAGWNKRRHQMVPCDEGTGAELSSSWNRMVYMNNENSSINNQMGSTLRRSNVNGTKIATMHDYYDNSDKHLVSPILWDMGRPYSVSSGWTTTSVGLRNISTGSTDIYGTGVCLDSSDNVYCTGIFYATNIDGSGSNANVFIAKYNSTGTLQWIYCLRAQAGGVENSMWGGDITIDGTDLYINGYCDDVTGSTTNAGPWIAKVDVSGTPSLTWINHAVSADYNCYGSSIKRIGSTHVVSMGYGQTPPGAVIGAGVSMNIDGSTTGSTTVDGANWTVTDMSPYIVFADAASGGTPNVSLINNGAVSIIEGAINNTTGGYYNTKVSGAPATTNTVESGGV